MTLPALGGNWVDFLILAFFLLALWEGWERGFAWGVVDFFGFTLSLLLAFKFYSPLGNLLILNFSFLPGIAKALGFLIIGVCSEILLFNLLSFLALKIIKKFPPVFLNKILGVFPAVSQTLVVLAFILTLLVTLPVPGNFKKAVLESQGGGRILAKTQIFERQLNQVFGQAAQETLTFLTIRPESQERIDLKFTPRELRGDEAAEVKMLALVNQERAKAKLDPLVMTEAIRQVARAHSKEMFTRGYFSHYTPEGLSPFERLTRGGVKFSQVGENLALAPNTDLAHSGLMNSSRHRENILSPEFRRVGIGVIDGGIYGEMFTQDFAD